MSFPKSQIAVVTGASGGIGKAITLQLALNGFVVGMIGRSLPSLEAVGKEADGIGRKLIAFRADLEIDSDIQRLATDLSGCFDGMDLLVHSAGLFTRRDFATVGVVDFDRHYMINARAPFLLTQAVLPLLRERRGQVVFLNSSSGIRAKAGAVAYSASKHALKAVADALRDEVNSLGIRVTSIYPGRTATPMWSKIFKAKGIPWTPEKLLQPEDVAQVVLDVLRMKRTAEITDVHVRPAIKSD